MAKRKNPRITREQRDGTKIVWMLNLEFFFFEELQKQKSK